MTESKKRALNLEQDEVRDDVFVDCKRKKVWAVELDLLERVISICEKHKIKYFAVGGTLLGAVRHRGFIPWDDDIDLGMLRKDYERFLKIAKAEFTEPFFVQTTETDYCYRPHIQIRNSNTTGYQAKEEGLKCNKGIFIDIFPLDGIPDNRLVYDVQIFLLKLINRMFIGYYFFEGEQNNTLKKRLLFQIVRAFFMVFGTKRISRLYDSIAKWYSNRPTKKVGQLTILFDDKRYHWKRSVFRKVVKLPFEHLDICVPAEYHLSLKHTFGNYMEYPEDRNERSLHSDMIFDPDTPYKRQKH